MTTAEELLLELLEPTVRADPYPVYARLLETSSVTEGPMGIVVVASHRDVDAALRDPRLLSDYRKATPYRAWVAQQGVDLAEWDADDTQPFLLRDPPDHTRLRRLVSKAFTPRSVERLRPRIEAITEELLDAAAGRGWLDVVADLASPLPIQVICELLGVPASERETFLGWSSALARGIDPPFLLEPAEREAQWQAVEDFHDYLRSLVADRRRAPGEDLLSELVAVRDAGDRLSEDELLGTCVLLLAAGHETTVNVVANGWLALLRHPDALAWVRAQPGLARAAVEETLRFDPPVQLRDRVAGEGVRIGDVDVDPGRPVLLLLAAANRDPARFHDPHRFDLDRDASGHLGFGAGIHYCLGAPLARLEGQIALAALARRVVAPSLGEEPLAYRDNVSLRGLRALEVHFEEIRPAAA